MSKKSVTVGLCLFQPWATQVIEGIIPFLISSSNSNSREPFGIVATKLYNSADITSRPEKRYQITSSLIGEVTIESVDIAFFGWVKNTVEERYGLKIANLYPYHLLKPHYEKYFIYNLKDFMRYSKPVPIKRKYLRGWIKLNTD